MLNSLMEFYVYIFINKSKHINNIFKQLTEENELNLYE